MKKIIMAITIVAILLCTSCTITGNVVEEEIKVGFLGPLSGPFADFGERFKQGIEEANTYGFNIIFEDSACDPAKTIAAYHKLVEIDKVDFIIGPACGSPQEAIAPLVKKDKVVTVIPYAATNKLYEISGEHMFQIQYSLEDEAMFIANAMQKYDKIALVHYQNAFSQTLAKSFRKTYDGEIIEIPMQEIGDSLYTPVLKIKESGVDAIFAADLSFFMGNGLARLEEINYPVPVYGQYAVQMPVMRELVEGVYYSFPEGMEHAASHQLPYEAGKIIFEAISECSGNKACVKASFLNSGDFDEGIFKRGIELRRIVNGQIDSLT